MIKKYTYGIPFNTEAVVRNMEAEIGDIPFFSLERVASDVIEFTLQLADNDVIYGLGEQVRGINKRGWEYVNWNDDNPHHHEDTRSLYGSHNFLIVKGEKTFGVFFDYPGKLCFDIGYTDRSVMTVTAEDDNLDVYIITADDDINNSLKSDIGINRSKVGAEKNIVKQFRALIGMSYVPPLWAFGYGQSRWGYKDEKDIRTVAEKYKEQGIPLDSIYLDIDYMEDYKDFTVSDERFPDLAKLSSDMKEQGIHLVPIIDAGVKIQDGYDVYEEGVKSNYFCKAKDGSDFVGAVWPGRVHFPDFMNPEVRAWFGEKYSKLTSLGIDGFWNDMNEPAIFYTEDRLEETLSKISELGTKNMGIKEYFEFTGMVAGLSCNKGDFDKFYHNVDGEMVQHSKIHNLYGMNMTRAAYEALQKIEPEKRTLFFSRSSYIGAHRYGGIWQGDNNAWWSHILQAMQQLPALNMAGFMFVGSDTGGFGCDTTEDLMIRWLQYAMFTPLFRNHSADGTRYQELYQFKSVGVMGEMIKIRYGLIPYIYSEFMKSVVEGTMMFRPLSFDFNDEDSLMVEDQLLLGDELMIAPIYKQNARGRYVYLPEEMMLVRMRTVDDFETEILEKGHHYVKAELGELVFFVRHERKVPFVRGAKNTDELLMLAEKSIEAKNIMFLGFENAEYELAIDDGISSDFKKTMKTVRL